MGITSSSQNQQEDGIGSSTGFGRLRIDSPDYRLRSPRYQDTLEKLRQKRKYSIGDDSNLKGPFIIHPNRSGEASTYAAAVEGSPLLNLQNSRVLHGSMEDTGSLESKSIMFEPGQLAPPLIQWIGPALLCALAYALYNIFIKKGSATIHPILGGVILQFVAALLGSVLCLSLVYGPVQEEMFYDSNGVWFAVYAGISVGAAEIISFMVSGMGVQAVQSIPTIIGGSVFFGTVLGWLLLNEQLSSTGWFGVALIAGGITLVGMDPGASLH